MSALTDAFTVIGDGIGTVAVAVAFVEARLRASEKRLRRLSEASLALGTTGRLLSELLESLSSTSEFTAGLVHRMLAGRADEIDARLAMQLSARTIQRVRRVGNHIAVICGDDHARAEAATNLRGGASDADTVEVLRIATRLHPDDDQLSAALRQVQARQLQQGGGQAPELP